MLNAHRGPLRAAGIEGSIRSVFHGPHSPQTQQEVVAGDQRQIHDLSRRRGIASAGGQHALVGLDRGLSEQIASAVPPYNAHSRYLSPHS
jgi:hypothetical protein